MYRIIVCGNQDEIKEIARICESFLRDQKIVGTVTATSQAEKLLLLGEKDGERVGVLLLDADGQGMSLAAQLREKHPDLSIILYAADMSLAFEGYALQLSGFLPKPMQQERLVQTLHRDYETRFMKNNLMVDEEPIRHRHIRYLEIAGKKVAVHLDNGDEVYLNGKLDDIAQLLPNEGIDRFVRCHQSYLVNLRHVESMQRYLLTFTDGEELPVSKAYTKAMQQAFTEYEN